MHDEEEEWQRKREAKAKETEDWSSPSQGGGKARSKQPLWPPQGETATMLVRLCEQARSGQAGRQTVAGMAKRQAAEMQSPPLLARSRVTGPPQGGPFLKRHFHLQLKHGLGGPERKGSEDEKMRVHRLKTSDK